jgi:hypothetical protein
VVVIVVRVIVIIVVRVIVTRAVRVIIVVVIVIRVIIVIERVVRVHIKFNDATVPLCSVPEMHTFFEKKPQVMLKIHLLLLGYQNPKKLGNLLNFREQHIIISCAPVNKFVRSDVKA